MGDGQAFNFKHIWNVLNTSEEKRKRQYFLKKYNHTTNINF